MDYGSQSALLQYNIKIIQIKWMKPYPHLMFQNYKVDKKAVTLGMHLAEA